MTEQSAIDKAEATVQPGGRFAFLLRPWFLIVVTFLVILVAIPLGYRTSRLAAIPPIEEIIDRKVEWRVEIDPDKNAFTFYERASKMAPPGLDEYVYSEDADALYAGGWDAVSPAMRKSLDLCGPLLDEWKRGTELKLALRDVPTDVDWHTQGDLLPFETLNLAVVMKSARCRHDGQLEEAWQWLRALFRFSRHFGNPGLIQDRYAGIECHHTASLQLVAWAAHNEVTAGHLETALSELRDIYRNTVANSTCLRIEYVSNVNTLSDPELVREMCNWIPGAGDVPPPQLLGTWLFVNAEPEVALMLQRHCFANYLTQCDRPLFERTFSTGTGVGFFLPSGTEAPPLVDPRTLDTLLTRSPIAVQFCADYYLIEESDNEQARQSALELSLLVELFRRRHGAYPDSLDALVPELIAEIPRDIFGATSTDRFLMVRREAAAAVTHPVDSFEELPDTAPGLIIYSRGANRTDGGGQIDYGDDIGLRIPFPLSEVKSE